MTEGVNIAALQAWMDAQEVGQGEIASVRALAGGTQNILLHFRRGDDAYVLRRPPIRLRANSNEAMRREARLLAALAASAVPHPRLVAACPDERILGAAFYLMEPVDGFNPTIGLPPLHSQDARIRHRIGLSMIEAIAALAAIDYREAGLEDFGKIDNYLARQTGRWGDQLASYVEHAGWPGPGGIPGVDKVARWLDAHRPSTFAPAIIHGDFHLANVMVSPGSGEVAALVDWELSTIGDPLLDLGWLLATWPEGEVPRPTDVAATPWAGFAASGELVAHYSLVANRPLDALDWYVVLACYKLGIILEGTYARACAGKAPRETGARLHAHAIDLFDRALRRIS
jgi:aminoglycoside phosphotransferase (APT) family kinase protein